MKKEYIQPSIKAHKVYPTQIMLGVSNTEYSGTVYGKQSSFLDDEDEENY